MQLALGDDESSTRAWEVESGEWPPENEEEEATWDDDSPSKARPDEHDSEAEAAEETTAEADEPSAKDEVAKKKGDEVEETSVKGELAEKKGDCDHRPDSHHRGGGGADRPDAQASSGHRDSRRSRSRHSLRRPSREELAAAAKETAKVDGPSVKDAVAEKKVEGDHRPRSHHRSADRPSTRASSRRDSRHSKPRGSRSKSRHSRRRSSLRRSRSRRARRDRSRHGDRRPSNRSRARRPPASSTTGDSRRGRDHLPCACPPRDRQPTGSRTERGRAR